MGLGLLGFRGSRFRVWQRSLSKHLQRTTYASPPSDNGLGTVPEKKKVCSGNADTSHTYACTDGQKYKPSVK